MAAVVSRAFEGPEGAVSLSELFADRRRLIVYHFMFDPSWDKGCPSCSYLADSFIGAILHLPARDTSFVVISRAPVEKIESFKKRMGWSFPWLSSGGTDFNYDFHVTLDDTHANTEYNFEPAAELVARGQTWLRGELSGLSVFLCDGGEIFHTYSTYGRSLDLLIGTYNYLDLTPLGRGADDQDPHTMWWVRHHDRYPSD